MKKIAKVINFIKNPHGNKIKQLKDKYQELDELSNVAVEISDVAAYRSLQAEMREVFFDYLTAVVVDSIYHLVPHVLIIWLISFKWQSITIPIVNWQTNILVAYLLSYLAYHIVKKITNIIRSKINPNFNTVDLVASEIK